jgi:hypothetical protein
VEEKHLQVFFSKKETILNIHHHSNEGSMTALRRVLDRRIRIPRKKDIPFALENIYLKATPR